jgi:hypothetical protein
MAKSWAPARLSSKRRASVSGGSMAICGVSPHASCFATSQASFELPLALSFLCKVACVAYRLVHYSRQPRVYCGRVRRRANYAHALEFITTENILIHRCNETQEAERKAKKLSTAGLWTTVAKLRACTTHRRNVAGHIQKEREDPQRIVAPAGAHISS